MTPKKDPPAEPSDERSDVPVADVLLPFGMFVNGQDVTVFAKDAKDAERRAEKLRRC